MSIVLGVNQYGKAENRVVRVYRDTARHEIRDLNASSALRGDFRDIAEIRFKAPNKHHFLVDLSPFGDENPGEVFYAADRPYGLIEAAVERDDASDPGSAWYTVPGFC